MAKIIDSLSGFFAPSAGEIVFDDSQKKPVKILDFDGVWWSEDPRIFYFIGMVGHVPQALIYQFHNNPPDELFGLTRKFIDAQAIQPPSTEAWRIQRRVSMDLSPDGSTMSLPPLYAPYLDTVSSAFQHYIGSAIIKDRDDLISRIRVHNASTKADSVFHLDSDSESVRKDWTIYGMLVGNRGTILDTASGHTMEGEAGEIMAWRGTRTRHKAPSGPYVRMTVREFGHYPTRPVPLATIYPDIHNRSLFLRSVLA